jgi:soluble lytic murein transglycosylase-like protein
MKMKRVLWTLFAISLAVNIHFLNAYAERALKVQASNYVEPPIAASEPIRLAVRPTAYEKSTSSKGYQSIKSGPLPPVSYFPAEKQYQTYLTNFIMNYNKKLSWEQADLMADAILDFSQRYSVDFRLVTGVIAVESAFRSDAVSRSGALGLAQLKPGTAQWLGVMNPFDPIDNIAGSVRYLSFLLSRYNGSLDHALAAYYQGQGTIDRNGVTEVCKPYLLKVNNVLSMFQ